MKVVFPDPLGPMREKDRPWLISMLKSSSARSRPKRLQTARAQSVGRTWGIGSGFGRSDDAVDHRHPHSMPFDALTVPTTVAVPLSTIFPSLTESFTFPPLAMLRV